MREAFLSRWRIGANMDYNNGLPTGTSSVGDEDAVPKLGMALDIGAAATDPTYFFMGGQLGAHLNYGRTVHNATMKKRIGIFKKCLKQTPFLARQLGNEANVCPAGCELPRFLGSSGHAAG